MFRAITGVMLMVAGDVMRKIGARGWTGPGAPAPQPEAPPSSRPATPAQLDARLQTIIVAALVILGPALALLGTALVLTAVALAFGQHRWFSNAEVTEGTVVAIVRGSGRGGVSPRVTFTAADGTVHTFTSDYYSGSEYSVGERVLVAYDPQTHEGRLVTFGQRFGLALFVGGAGLVLLVISLGYFRVLQVFRGVQASGPNRDPACHAP
jgi:hypothetical protein